MPTEDADNKDVSGDSKPATPTRETNVTDQENATSPKEIGGRKGPDPTRYGDWEKGGRCIDF